MSSVQNGTTIGQKLLEVQKELGVVYKDQNNPFFKSKYADINSYIDAIKPVLNKHELVILQPLVEDGIATVILDARTGAELRFDTAITPNPDPQKMGSAITYFRRYALQSLFVMKAEDTDGNDLTNTKEKQNDW